MNCEVGIIGAGVAGLAAAVELSRAGLTVRCLEATNRIGGRILTVREPAATVPIELGAEFVHGRPPETWELIRSQSLTVFEHTPHALLLKNGKEVKDTEVGEMAERLMANMGKGRGRRDRTFEDFLKRSRHSADAKTWARRYVEGFNAARSDLISVGSLAAESEAADKIDGDRAFRILDGYDSIPVALLRQVPDHESVIRLSSVVEKVRWKRGRVEVDYRSALTDAKETLRCRRLVISVPLGVLQAPLGSAGAIEFQPEPAPVLRAARLLKFGQAYHVTLRFREAFWEEDEQLRSAGFLVSQEKRFFTWWTVHPVLAPILTAWMAGSAAEEFVGADPKTVSAEALASLGRILNRKIPQPQSSYFHDWKADPYFRGAYSYVPAGALGAREALAKPQSGTLFFAGEAADVHGHGSTVHGAIASGRRAAALIIGR
jgi:monoamine oxidase